MNKTIILLPTALALTACVAPQAYFPQLPQQYINNNSSQSKHEKLSKMKADQFFVVGQTTAADISMRYGVPDIAMKGERGNDIWMYQAKSVVADVKVDTGSNFNAVLGSTSSASSVQGQTEISSKSTLLKITLNPFGVVEAYESETTMN